jgi:hypothetical protein
MRHLWLARAFMALASAIFVVGLSGTAAAGVWTDTLSSFDEDNPVDVAFEATYRYGWTNARINRERISLASAGGASPYNEVLLTKELEVSRATQILELAGRVGLYHDLDLTVVLPIWLSDQTTYKYQPAVSEHNTTINNNATPSSFLFQVPYDGPDRKGLGDLRLGLRWKPFNQDRDPEEANWQLATEFTLPTSTVRAGGNTAVGEGLALWHLSTTISRRYFRLVEPYFETHGVLRFPSADSLFKNYGSSQTLVNPGHQIGINLGVEITPWERPKLDRYVSVDLGFGSDYRFEGRAYSELFEALAGSDCGGPAYPSCEITKTNSGLRADGITDVSHYGTFHSWVGVNLQFIRFFRMRFGFDYQYDKSHILTNADAGKDRDLSGLVEGDDEFNPIYNENYDKVGSRFVVDGVNHFLFYVALDFKY